jgi:hypothetical protein
MTPRPQRRTVYVDELPILFERELKLSTSSGRLRYLLPPLNMNLHVEGYKAGIGDECREGEGQDTKYEVASYPSCLNVYD